MLKYLINISATDGVFPEINDENKSTTKFICLAITFVK